MLMSLSPRRISSLEGFILRLFGSGDDNPEFGRFAADPFGLFAAKGGAAVGFASKRVPVTPWMSVLAGGTLKSDDCTAEKLAPESVKTHPAFWFSSFSKSEISLAGVNITGEH